MKVADPRNLDGCGVTVHCMVRLGAQQQADFLTSGTRALSANTMPPWGCLEGGSALGSLRAISKNSSFTFTADFAEVSKK